MKNSIARFNDKDYYFSISLLNSSGNFLMLNRNALVSLKISDSIFSLFNNGSMIILNTFNAYDQFAAATMPFTFIGDGRDIVSIRLMPSITGNDSDFTDPTITMDNMLYFDFVVTECQDITHDSKLCKKLILTEFDAYILNEKQCAVFSALLLPKGTNILALNNKDRQVQTGTLLQAIIKAAMPLAKFDSKNFDLGAEKIFFASQDHLTCMDAINYILNYQVGTKNHDFCILYAGRYDKIFRLEPISQIFTNHQQSVTECLTWDIGISKNKDAVNNNAVTWNHSPMWFGENSTIQKSHIIDTSANINIDFYNSQSICTISKPNNSLIVDNETANINTMYKLYEKYFVEPFKSIHSKPISNVVINTTKQSNSSITLIDCAEPRDLGKCIASNALLSLIFLNACYQFTLRGMTHRQTLTFTDIIKIGSNVPGSDFDKKHCGRHLITHVEHIFEGDAYYNQIETIKTYKLG